MTIEQVQALQFCIDALETEAGGLYKAHIEQARAALTVPDGENACPECGADIDVDEDKQFDGDGTERAPWTCPECGAEGVQVREIIFTEHERVKTPEDFAAVAKAALYPDGPRTMYADEDGTADYKAIGGGTGKWGPQITRAEAERLLEQFANSDNFTIYCKEASDVPGLWAGIEYGDMEDGKLPEGWETFEVETSDGPHTFER